MSDIIAVLEQPGDVMLSTRQKWRLAAELRRLQEEVEMLKKELAIVRAAAEIGKGMK